MSCIIIIVMMMMMMMMTIFDTLQITVVALDGCYKFFKNRRTYKKKKESSAFLKCNLTAYCCVYMYSMEYVFFGLYGTLETGENVCFCYNGFVYCQVF